VAAVLRDDRRDRRQVQHLVDERRGVVAVEGVAAAAALGGTQVEGVVRGQRRSEVALMPLLAAFGPLPGGLRGPAFDVGAIGGRRLGGVGGVEAETLLEGPHLSVEGVEAPLLVLEGQDQCGLGSRRDLVPQRSGNRRLERPDLILQTETRQLSDP
jgi:hypothetical protein